MRNKFDEQLELLNTQLMEMGALCESAIANAAKALTEEDVQTIERAKSIEEEIDNKERVIEALCLKLLLQQQPVAKDLRQISAALKMVTDMERIGDQAADITEITMMIANVYASANIVHIGQMAKATIKMVTDSIEAYVHSDRELAKSVVEYDDVVDDLFNKVKREVIDVIGRDTKNGEYAMDILMIAKYFERIGDHATNIAEWVEYSISGLYKGKKL